MMLRKTLTLSVLLALASAPALAKDEGFYVGASLGSASIQQKGIDDIDFPEFDESDFAWKLFVGYQFGPVFAVEGSYRDLGSPTAGAAKVDPYGLDVFAVAGIPLGPIRGFGKLGGIYWDSDTKFEGQKSSDDGFDLAAGVGLEFELGSFAIRGEVEYLDILDETWMYTIGATITF
ncbi:outer membrane beta-barrel protein [Ferrimonas balearica]|uniref:outer membrane beta-barrel protein n=1 Tax=Ferrimonas balearica TaxID=44012 RepID=UPI001C9934BD|nr:outer membrane beta-barrel protein [Ferrimonas balearica]MBY5921224.1 outer membrane beta-barrel protein [Ferrimonas balearica]MBY5996091.1 outer membrane beta-barrel protein [Ferrimonas balearica]